MDYQFIAFNFITLVVFQAVLKVEKVELGIWIEIPCVNSIGSCTYDDLCIYSLPLNETCPESFISNNVPCRCPISKVGYLYDNF